MNRILIFTLSLLSILTTINAEELYKTSFEKPDDGKFQKLDDDTVQWLTKGGSEITSKYHKTGKKCLHIFGGRDNTLELVLSGELKNAQGISFQAERWTSKSPFAFRINAQTNGAWQEIANLDQLVSVGARFKSHIVLNMPPDPVERLQLVVTAPANAGVLIDDFALLKDTPKKVTKAAKVTGTPIKKLLESKDLFVSGTEKTHTFRIPAIITAPNGDLIACCDARRKSSKDLIWVRDIDIVVRRSSDNGKTWSAMEIVCDYGDGKPASDPSFILDKTTGEIFCLYNYMDQDNAPKEFRLYVQSSKDNGKTWSKSRDITDQIALPAWKMDFKFITSGRGIQRRNGELLHTMVNLKNGLRLFGSKDHGSTWHMIDVPVRPANESKVIELADGGLMINSRVNRGADCRWVHVSKDDGKTWDSKADHTLIDPGCNASILRYTSTQDGYDRNRLLFCNANSPNGRKNLTVRISYDEGATWCEGKVIDKGPSAYSSLTICKDGTIGVLYEPGYKAVRFARFTLEDLTDGKDKLSKPYKP